MRLRERIDVVAAMAGIVIGLLLVGISLRLNTGTGLSVTLLISSALYILISLYRPEQSAAENKLRLIDGLSNRSIVLLSLISTFLILLFGIWSIYSFYHSGYRPLWFFIVLSMMIGFVFLEVSILSNKVHVKMVEYVLLLNIIAIIGITIFSSVFVYEDLSTFGGGDNQIHEAIIGNILSGHHLSTTHFTYKMFPLVHVLFSAGEMFTNVYSYNDSAVLFEVVPYIFSLVVLYVVFKKMADTVVALYATFLTGICMWYIYWGLFMVPMSFSILFFSILIYLLVIQPKKFPHVILILFFSTVIMFTHPVTAIAMVILGIAYCLYYALRIKRPDVPNENSFIFLYMAYLSILVIYYLSVTGFFFSLNLNLLLLRLTMGKSMVLSLASNKPAWMYELDNTGMYVLYVFCIVFVFNMLKNARTFRVYEAFVVICVSLFVLTSYSFFILGMASFLPHRWLVFAALLIGYPASGGLKIILEKISGQRRRIVALFVIVTALAFVTVTSTTINADSPLYGKYYVKQNSLKDSDLQASAFIENNMDSKSVKNFGEIYIPYSKPIAYTGRYLAITYKELSYEANCVYDNGILNVYRG